MGFRSRVLLIQLHQVNQLLELILHFDVDRHPTFPVIIFRLRLWTKYHVMPSVKARMAG